MAAFIGNLTVGGDGGPCSHSLPAGHSHGPASSSSASSASSSSASSSSSSAAVPSRGRHHRNAPGRRGEVHAPRGSDNSSLMGGGGCVFDEAAGAHPAPRRVAVSYKNDVSDPTRRSQVKKQMLDHGSMKNGGQFRYHYDVNLPRGRKNIIREAPADRVERKGKQDLRRQHDELVHAKEEARRVRGQDQRYHKQTDSTHFVGTSMMANPPTPSVFPPPRSGIAHSDERAEVAVAGRAEGAGGRKPQRRNGPVYSWSHRASE